MEWKEEEEESTNEKKTKFFKMADVLLLVI